MNRALETDQYAKEVLCNTSLIDLPGEEWKLIEDFENYTISNYGRVKSLKRKTISFRGIEMIQPELIMKLLFVKHCNKYLDRSFYGVQCSLSSQGRKDRKSVARLVYYHFVEKFEMNDRTVVMSYKDGNSLNLHSSNLEKLSVHELRLKTYRNDRGKNLNVHYLKPVSQYTVEGDPVADFESVYDAEKAVGVGRESILDVINKRFLTAGGFRWFLQSDPPKKEDFIVQAKSESQEKRFNKFLWEKLGKPLIDQNNLPGCMNLSLEDMPGEEWKPIPGFEDHFVVSNKGRIKHLSGWTSSRRKIFLQDRILSQTLSHKGKAYYSLYVTLMHNGKTARITTARLLYCCFVEEFNIFNKTLVLVNQNESLWDMDISKLSLHPVHSVLKGKGKRKTER